jgi:predicted nuclease of predicted toxin-antitoxin system
MRFLVDECAGPSMARWLQEQGHDVFSVFDQARGINDDEVLQIGLETERILITVDKDFGEKIFREEHPPGVQIKQRSWLLVYQGSGSLFQTGG